MIEKDTKNYYEGEINRVDWTLKAGVGDLISRVEYYESEIKEINRAIEFFNSFLQSEKIFEFLVIYPSLKKRFQEIQAREHGKVFNERRAGLGT